MKNQIKKSLKQTHSVKQIRSSDDSQREGESDADKKAAKKKKKPPQNVSSSKKSALIKKSNGSIKRKKTKDDDKSGDKNIVTKKRMASLNASAILAANYEIENYAAKHESSSTETSDSSDSDEKDEIKPPTMKKEKKDVKMETEEVNDVLSGLIISFVLLFFHNSFPLFALVGNEAFDINVDVKACSYSWGSGGENLL